MDTDDVPPACTVAAATMHSQVAARSRKSDQQQRDQRTGEHGLPHQLGVQPPTNRLGYNRCGRLGSH